MHTSTEGMMGEEREGRMEAERGGGERRRARGDDGSIQSGCGESITARRKLSRFGIMTVQLRETMGNNSS